MATTSTRFFHLSLTGPAYGRLEEAERFYLAGNLNEALAAAQQAWREHPRDPDVFRVLAYIHMARGEYPPAAQAAYQSVVVDDDNVASYATLTQVYLTFNMLSNAQETLAVARQRYPLDAALMVLSADLLFRTRKDEAAAKLAHESLTINPQDGYAKALLGVHYLRKKRYTEAAEYLGEAVRVYPQRWDYMRDFGIALLHTRSPQIARQILTQSLQLNQADDAIKQHLFYALRLTAPQPSWYWQVSFYFYNHTGLGWFLNILGLIAASTGFIWGAIAFSAALYSEDSLAQTLESVGLPALFLLGGIALLALTQSGILMRNRKGKRFDVYLANAIAGE